VAPKNCKIGRRRGQTDRLPGFLNISRSIQVPGQPPRDAAGNVIPQDQPDILNDHIAIRCISEKQIVIDASDQPRSRQLRSNPRRA
jgi:hypothetical protein